MDFSQRPFDLRARKEFGKQTKTWKVTGLSSQRIRGTGQSELLLLA